MSVFSGTGIRLGGGDRTLQEVRTIQQANYTANRDFEMARTKYLLDEQNRLAQEEELIKKVEANPSNRGNQQVEQIRRRRAAAKNLDAAFSKLDAVTGGLIDGFRVFAGACIVALMDQDLDAQIKARDTLAPDFAALEIALKIDEFNAVQKNAEFTSATDYQRLVLFQTKATAAWQSLNDLIKLKAQQEIEAERKARQAARDAELDRLMEQAVQKEKAARGARTALPKPKAPPVLLAPGSLPGAPSVTALAIYTWAYTHATDVNQANWRAAYRDAMNRPLGPSYPASETITFPGGVRHIVPSAAAVRVSLAVVQEVRALWGGQSLVVGEDKIGNRMLTGSTEPHVSGPSGNHINLVLEKANVVSNASVLNLHVRIA
jgi:hypothetical protein